MTVAELKDEAPVAISRAEPIVFVCLDAFRGFAALWVVMYHSCLNPIQSRFPQLRHNAFFAFSLVGMLGVQLFFVISGFCIANAASKALGKGQGWRKFAWARARRIYPPYWCSLALTACVLLLANWLALHGQLKSSQWAHASILHHSAEWYIAQLTLTQILLQQEPLTAVFWTLCYEVAFYLIVAMVIHALRTARSPQLLLPVLNLITVGSMAVLIFVPAGRSFPLDLWPEFGMGVLAFDFIAHSRGGRRPWIVAIVFVAELAAFFMTTNYGADASHLGSRATFAVASTFAVVLVLLHPIDSRLARSRLVKGLCWLGSFSFSLYLTHLVPLGVVWNAARPFLKSAGAGRFGFVYFAEILAAILFAYPFFLLFELPLLSPLAVARVSSESFEAGVSVGCDRLRAAEEAT